ncbi:MAG: hypothetical protein O6952_01320 [Planctomycetota bacterium]|nr:hypothetical protein [Planctomycetota bacterium]
MARVRSRGDLTSRRLPGAGPREAQSASRFLMRAPPDDGSVRRDRSPPRRYLFGSKGLAARRFPIGLSPTMGSMTDEGEILGAEPVTGGIGGVATTKAGPRARFDRRGQSGIFTIDIGNGGEIPCVGPATGSMAGVATRRASQSFRRDTDR